MKLLGEKIWRLREKRGLSQEELAELLGVSRQTVSNWENDRATPDAYKLKQLCETLHVSADALLETDIAPAEISAEAPQESVNVPQEKPRTPVKTRRGTVFALLLAMLAATLIAVGIVLIVLPYESNTTSSVVIFTPMFGGIPLCVVAAGLLISALVLFFKKK